MSGAETRPRELPKPQCIIRPSVLRDGGNGSSLPVRFGRTNVFPSRTELLPGNGPPGGRPLGLIGSCNPIRPHKDEPKRTNSAGSILMGANRIAAADQSERPPSRRTVTGQQLGPGWKHVHLSERYPAGWTRSSSPSLKTLGRMIPLRFRELPGVSLRAPPESSFHRTPASPE